jgi:predicted MPP superfamily phosphohydrolase
MEVKIFFPGSADVVLTAEDQTIFRSAELANRARQVLQKVLEGPKTPGLFPSIPKDTKRRTAAMAPVDTTRVFLYHSPELMPEAPANDIDLYLCGHTHGGQVRLPGFGALFTSAATGKRYEMGRYDEGGTTLYVSRGIGLEGYSMPRLRLFCPPEITLVTIESSKTA